MRWLRVVRLLPAWILVEDPVVTVEIRGSWSGLLRTAIAENTLTPTWNIEAQMLLAPGETLEIAISDADAVFNDSIAKLRVPFVGPKMYVLQEPTRGLHNLLIDVRPLTAPRAAQPY